MPTDPAQRTRWSARARAVVVFNLLPLASCADAPPAPSFLVLPAKDVELRVATWNIKDGRESSLDAIAARLESLDADVVALQEVDRNVGRTGNVDQTQILADLLGYVSVFAPAMPLDGGEYGIALLSRNPLTRIEHLEFSDAQAAEPRTALDVDICTDGLGCVRLINHHADYIQAAARISAAELLEQVRPTIGAGLLVVGDFNLRPVDESMAEYVRSGLHDLVGEFREAPTFADKRIDFIFADDPLAACVRRAGVVLANESDHRPVIADIAACQ